MDAECAAVFDLLADVGSYPSWWPQVRSVTAYDGEQAMFVIRSALPYSLRMRAERLVEDRAAGVLAVRLTGDLDGEARWTIKSTSGGCQLRYEQRVVMLRPLLRRLGPVGRALLRLNHAWMMRAGERGLRHRLAGTPGSEAKPTLP